MVEKAKREKNGAGKAVSYLEQVSTRGPKFEVAEFLPQSELVGECLPQTQQNERNDHFSHTEVFKNARTLRHTQTQSRDQDAPGR